MTERYLKVESIGQKILLLRIRKGDCSNKSEHRHWAKFSTLLNIRLAFISGWAKQQQHCSKRSFQRIAPRILRLPWLVSAKLAWLALLASCKRLLPPLSFIISYLLTFTKLFKSFCVEIINVPSCKTYHYFLSSCQRTPLLFFLRNPDWVFLVPINFATVFS